MPTALDRAAGELHHAADLVAGRADGDLFSPWTALAEHIRLVAAGISATPDSATSDAPTAGTDPRDHITAALTLIDSINVHHTPPDPHDADRRPDLSGWRAHITDLLGLLADAETTRGSS